MLDPSTSDISGRVLEMLSFYGIGLGSRAARRGLDFLTKQQERDGSWYGRWAVSYTHLDVYKRQFIPSPVQNDA